MHESVHHTYITLYLKKRDTFASWQVNHRLHVHCDGYVHHILWVPVHVPWIANRGIYYNAQI